MPRFAGRRRSILLALLCVASAMVATGAPVVAAEKFVLDSGWEEEKKADFVINYDHNGKLDLGIGAVRDGVSDSIRFTLDELAWFWEHQRHKQFIVIVLAKWNPSDEQLRVLGKRLTDYFFKAGFRRVLVRQGTGGPGYIVVSDAINPNEPAPAKPR